ncbi:hypothetical protein [Bradyrhizobium sp. USDA 10063]
MSDVVELSSDEISEQILKLRVAGSSARDIAKHFGISVAEVNRKLDAALGTIDNRARSRQLLLDLALMTHLQRPFVKLAMQGDVAAAALVLKIAERRAAYLGLDVPTKLDIVQQVQSHQPNSTERIRGALDRLIGPQRHDPPA